MTRTRLRIIQLVAVSAAALVVSAPVAARAQAIGVGARMSLVRGDTADGTAADRFTGGFVRLRPSPRTAIEVAFDYRSHVNDDLTERIKDLPIQASLLLYPIRAAVAPYLVGGVGWYTQKITILDGADALATESTRTFGYHAGIGGEVRLGEHAAVHADYRYTFIRFGSDETSETGGVPILSALTDQLKPSHQGSMWTVGVGVYF